MLAFFGGFCRNPRDPWIDLLVPVSLAAFLFVRDFNFWAFVCGFFAGVLAVAPVTLTLGRSLVGFLVAHSLATRGLVGIMASYAALIPSIPAAAAIWATQLIKGKPRASRIPG